MKTVMYALLLTAMMRLPGCASQQEQPLATKGTQISDKYHIEVKMSPTPAQSLQENSMYITLTDLNGQAVSQANVIVSLSMKSMNHGELSVPAIPTEDGTYIAKVVPVMGGEWVAEVTAQISDHKVQTLYPFNAKW